MYKKIIFLLIMFSCLTTWLISCTKESADKLEGNVGCDTTNVSYSMGVVPILQDNCYSCHGTGSTGGSGGILLQGYSNLLKWANNGYLVGNVTHAPGYVPMPYDGNELPACEVNTIVAWVHQGSLNN